MVRTLPFHGKYMGSIPIRDCFGNKLFYNKKLIYINLV